MGGGQTIVSIRIRSGNELKGGQGIGAGGGQTIVSIRIISGNKRRSGIIFLTRLEKSDLSRDFFSCLDFVGDRKDFFILNANLRLCLKTRVVEPLAIFDLR